jgi:hypothetical protein
LEAINEELARLGYGTRFAKASGAIQQVEWALDIHVTLPARINGPKPASRD